MNDTVKTTRKNFLKWSGLSLIGGWLLAGNRFFKPKDSEAGDRMDALQGSLAAASRIRPAQNTVVRERI